MDRASVESGRLEGYILFKPLILKPFRRMTKGEASSYLEHFLSLKEARMGQITSLLFESKFRESPLDWSLKSLEAIEQELAKLLRKRNLDNWEVQEREQSIPEHLRVNFPTIAEDILPKQVLDDTSYSLCIDFGMYYGTMIINDLDLVTWSVGGPPKSDINYNQPVIRSDLSDAVVNPVGTLITLAHHLIAPEETSVLSPWRQGLRTVYSIQTADLSGEG